MEINAFPQGQSQATPKGPPQPTPNPNAPLWIDIKSNQYPTPGERVLITVQHKSIPGLGNMQVGRYKLTGEWVVDPPYVRYCELTSEGQLTNGVVTHWARASKEILESWDRQNDIIGDWKMLRVEVDNDHEEDVYKGLTLAASYVKTIFDNMAMQKIGSPEQLQEMMAVMNILTDMRNSIHIWDGGETPEEPMDDQLSLVTGPGDDETTDDAEG